METNIFGFLDCSNLTIQDTLYGSCKYVNHLHIGNILLGAFLVVSIIAMILVFVKGKKDER